jgi:hypothetical protein
MPILTKGEVLSYNGVTFPGGTSTKAQMRFIYDSSGRTVTHTLCTINAAATIAGGANQNDTIEAIRAALERPGGQLVYTGRGMDLSINTGGANPSDLAWGPKPRMLSFATHAGSYAAKIEWQVEVALLGCEDAPFEGEIMEYNTEIQFSQDHSGYTKRSVTGHIVIPMTRIAAGNRRVPDSADNYFERIVPELPKGFRRESTDRRLSEDRTRLDFTFVDQELPTPLPFGVVEASGSHSLENAAPRNFCKWSGTIEMEYEVARDWPRGVVWGHFMTLIQQRIKAEVAAGPRGTFPVPVKLRMTEPLYDRKTASFSFGYMLASGDPGGAGAGLVYWFPVGGLWKPLPGDHDRWATSLEQSAHVPRGLTKLKHNPRNDAIVDLCLSSDNEIEVDNDQAKGLQAGIAPLETQWDQLRTKLGVPKVPSPPATWLHYEAQITVEPHDHTSVHVPLPTGPTVFDAVLRTPRNSDTYPFARQATPGPIAQASSSPTYHVRLSGRALRLAYEISAPSLKSVGGSPVVPANDPDRGCFWRTWVAGFSTHAIHAAEFNLRWLVVRPTGAGSTMVEMPGRPDEPKQIF